MSVWLERADGRADARNDDTRLIVEAACKRSNGIGLILRCDGPSTCYTS